jgi:hypothetical protein
VGGFSQVSKCAARMTLCSFHSCVKQQSFPPKDWRSFWKLNIHVKTYLAITTKNSTIGRVSTVLVTVDTRPISHVYTVHVARNMRITVGRLN